MFATRETWKIWQSVIARALLSQYILIKHSPGFISETKFSDHTLATNIMQLPRSAKRPRSSSLRTTSKLHMISYRMELTIYQQASPGVCACVYACASVHLWVCVFLCMRLCFFFYYVSSHKIYRTFYHKHFYLSHCYTHPPSPYPHQLSHILHTHIYTRMPKSYNIVTGIVLHISFIHANVNLYTYISHTHIST